MSSVAGGADPDGEFHLADLAQDRYPAFAGAARLYAGHPGQ